MPTPLIQALMTPEPYPHPVQEIQLIETHISWVLLTGEKAYKIKKPVDMEFLDFSTLDKRRHFCEEELRLNRRLASELYLDVMAITGSVGAPRIQPIAEAEGEVLDYALCMRQFDQAGLLDALAREGTIDDALAKSLGRELARFHAQEATVLSQDQAYARTDDIIEQARQNLRQIAPLLDSDQRRQAIQALSEWVESTFAQLAPLMNQRREEGFVRECHGDLHLGNMALIDGTLTLFDCIEFNPAFRWIDVQSELAFVLMDMEERGLDAQANRVLNVYLEHSGDYAGLALLSFYKSYRALVRAKVIVMRLASGQDDLDDKERQALWRRYDRYITLADSYCRPLRPMLVVTHGLSGSGKSTIAAQLAPSIGAIRLRSDVERKRLAGLAVDERSSEAEKQRLYSDQMTEQTFARLASLARGVLEAQYSVIVDATFLSEDSRRVFRELAEALSLRFVILDCQASEAALVQRLETRARRQKGASDAGVEVMRAQQTQKEAFTEEERPHVLAVDTEQDWPRDLLRRLS